MVEFPSYIRVVSGNSTRRATGSTSKTATTKDARAVEASEAAFFVTTGNARTAEVVSLIARENQLAAVAQTPTASQAAEALRRLREDLPGLGQGVGDLHSKLDRHRVIDLLAPLVEN